MSLIGQHSDYPCAYCGASFTDANPQSPGVYAICRQCTEADAIEQIQDRLRALRLTTAVLASVAVVCVVGALLIVVVLL